jgi:hypothetical protein
MRSPSVLPLQALSVHLLLPVHANIVNSAYRWDERGPTSVISRYPVKDSSFFSVLTLAVYTFSTSAFTCDKASFIEYMRSSSGFFAAADRVRVRVLMTVAMDALCGDVSEESKLNKDKEHISAGNALKREASTWQSHTRMAAVAIKHRYISIFQRESAVPIYHLVKCHGSYEH